MLDDELTIDIYPDQDIRILAGMVKDRGCAMDCALQLKVDMFSESVRPVANFFFDYVKSNKSLPTQRVTREEVDAEVADAVWERILQIQFNREDLPHDIKKLKQKYIDLQTEELSNDLQLRRLDLATLEKRVKSIREISSTRSKPFDQEDLKSYVDRFRRDYIEKAKNPSLNRGILTQYKYFDYILNGAREAELWIIGGATGSGKSVWLNNLAVQMWMQENTINTDPSSYTPGYNVVYFSLEMPFVPTFRRAMAKIANVPIYGLRDASLNKEQSEQVKRASEFIKKYPSNFRIIDCPRGVSVELMEQIYLEVCASFKPDVVFVDYLGLLQDRSVEGDDWLKLGKISADLHEFARVHSVPVITAVQLNRQSQNKKDEGDSIGVHRFGRSSMIAHNANVCFQIESKEKDHWSNETIMHLIKNRDGEVGSHTFTKEFANATISDTAFEKSSEKEIRRLEGFDTSKDISKQLSAAIGIDLVKR